MKKYIIQANEKIEVVYFSKTTINLNELKRESGIEEIKNNQCAICISSDKIETKDECEIIERILDLNKNIYYIANEEKEGCFLRKKYKSRVFLNALPSMANALVVDIYIFFRNENILNVLVEQKKVFNAVHPNNFPATEKDIEKLMQDRNRLKFLYKENYEKIFTYRDYITYAFGKYLNNLEIEEYSRATGIDIFYKQVEFAIRREGFLSELRNRFYKNKEYFKKLQSSVHNKESTLGFQNILQM